MPRPNSSSHPVGMASSCASVESPEALALPVQPAMACILPRPALPRLLAAPAAMLHVPEETSTSRMAAVHLSGAQRKQQPDLSSNAASYAISLHAAPQVKQPTFSVQTRRFGQLLDITSDAVVLGGHRGMGQNMLTGDPEACQPAYRENTIASFKQAIQSGATFVEFDVQVTADGVPVIWHDDTILLGDPGGQHVARKICDLTLAEFKAVLPQGSIDTARPLLRQFRVQGSEKLPVSTMWACQHEEPLPTLAEVFQQLPESVAFDLEVKMAVPHDVRVTPQAEVDRMVNAVLATCGAFAHQDRTVVFTSFDPEICLALSAGRPDAPVMFLSTGGSDWHCDPRRMSLSAAVAFAASSGLQGVVLDSDVLRRNAVAVSEARRSGLVVLTYGLANNEPEWVRKQYFLGVHGVIVDNVPAVAQALSVSAIAM